MINNLPRRLFLYFAGLFVMTAGIAISVKSNLGVSPVSSIPYTMTCVWGIEMGKATILYHCVLIFLQIVLLRKNFKLHSLLQLPAGIIFGYFTTFCNYLMTFLPGPQNLVLRLCMLLFSIILIAFGIFFYLPAGIMPLAAEGFSQAISDTFHVPFAKVKVGFDLSAVLISLTVCLITLHAIGSVGIGTVAAALLVGTILAQLTKHFAGWRDRILGTAAE